MPRNSSGVYTLPAGNPVTAGTTIDASWANTTLSDLANEITNSLDRNGNGGMLAAFRFSDGTLSAPGMSWLNETSTGFYRSGTGTMWAVVQANQVAQFTANGITLPTGKNLVIGGTFSVTGTSTFTGAITATGGVVGNVTGAVTGNVTGNCTGTAANVTGTVAVANGGTGATTLTGLVKGSGTTAFTAAVAGTDYVAPGGALGTPSSGTLTNCTFPTLNQNTTGSAATLTTARTLTVGATGKTFNGSANVTWTLAEIGAAASGANTDITSVAATTTINSYTIGYREVPQNAQSTGYTFAASDVGKHVYSTNSGAQTVTVPTNASVAINVGTAITVVNNGTTAITFTTTGTTVYKAGTSAAWASGGTLAIRGMATFLKVATDTWFVSGSGLS